MNVEAELQKLNWNKNDARIYVALVELGRFFDLLER
jgi:sugar-specific transcriptional regulator TrmB